MQPSNIFIEGYFARLMYRSLYKMHEYALPGAARFSSARTVARGAAGQIALA
jgi:NADH dehydrogenase